MKRVAQFILIACFTLVVGNGCHDDPPYHPDLFRISGTITDSLTGNPIDSAWVTNEPTSPEQLYFTDSLGGYEVHALEGVRAELRVGKEGYVTKERTFEPLRGDLGGIDFKLVLDSLP